jgi:hypothetical protein
MGGYGIFLDKGEMGKPAQLGMALILGFALSSTAAAQMRGGGVAVRLAPVRQPASMRVTPFARTPAMLRAGSLPNRRLSVVQVAGDGFVTPANIFLPSSTILADQLTVPGLGFDFVHLAAVSGGLAFTQPVFVGGRHLHDTGFFNSGFITPVFFGGYPYYPDYQEYQPPQQPPQVIVIQQPVPTAVAPPAAGSGESGNVSAVPPASVAPSPVRDVGEFILVRRDGKVLFASVYSIIGSEIRYVTPEGIRHTLPVAELDADATRAMNEARGTTVQF